MFPIAKQTVGAGGVASLTFANIPQTYTHLQLRVFGRGTTNFSAGLSLYITINGDSTAANYTNHGLFGEGSAAYSTNLVASGVLSVQQCLADSSKTAGIFGTAILDILDYTNTSKNKVTKTIAGYDGNGSGRAMLYSNVWLSTAAITQLVVSTDGNLVEGSVVALYGLQTSSVTGA